MRKTLADIFTAAREHECPIVHISMLAGEEPFIASSPCLGDASVPLVDITVDDYLGLMAEIRSTMVVEHDETLSFLIFTGGARDPQAAQNRVHLAPRTRGGVVHVDGAAAAIYYLLDSAGQETTLLYMGLHSYAGIQAYWKRRGELVRDFAERYAPVDEDVHDLCYHLDRTTQLAAFDVGAFARRRGLAPNASAAING